MTMWKVTVAPDENLDAWQTYVQQGIIAIGWPERRYDSESQVVRFRQISRGDWVVAHVPPSHGGAPATAKGIGQVIGDYYEVKRSELPAGDGWSGAFRRQYRVRWTLGDKPLRGILNSGHFRQSCILLPDELERRILEPYRLG
jgi:hypothetical protein